MIINLNLGGKKIVVVGAGKEAQKRINSLLKNNCKILVISNKISKPVESLVKQKKIEFKKLEIKNGNFLKTEKPDIVITTTDDKNVNEKIISQAKKRKILAYSSDNPEMSDFSNPAVIDLQDTVQIAIFTGGRSPSMSKKIKEQIEKSVKKSIKQEELDQIKIQQIARRLAKEKITTQSKRKSFLNSIMGDKEIKQLIKDRKTKKVENRIVSILREW
ncbi:MAG: bifunctional precorrin-2 dehydrogenase/sirohydrochlorin ferrochelatase [Nitrosopumilaceae archaeon]|nr:bifunctional precorrin-2 dehydrogenase/sirohydrochlorin ferrochelatase [Nitrosopumilaceae archaeon]NIP09343.1 bifunctional precorrin-2 dehydrogenase/sirohydrochlorin ferrochelatase [Nitrosopumilaceae archaeon]NIS94497.1 bifunctional precorrin-2 dehydrogenase/sirohydrochlorin ferrochelatase [Nitrosopumilaceae archaeon]